MKRLGIAASAAVLLCATAYAAQPYIDGNTITHGVVIVDPASPNGGGTGALGTAANPLHTTGGTSSTITHAATTTLVASVVMKASSGALAGFNCTAITGGSAGYCIVINATTAPTTGSTVAPLDFCYFDTTARGCSLGRAPLAVTYGTGITILVTTAASPYTFTSGTDTAAISADYQ